MLTGLRVLTIAAVACWAASATARDFRAADTQVENYPTVQALMYMSRLIDADTGGRHRIRVFHSRQLGEEKETLEQTRVGAIELNRTNVAPLGSFIKTANVLALPFLFRSNAHLHKVLDGPIGDEILSSFEPFGLVGLAFYDSGARSIYNTKRPIRTIADMRGLRLRVQQSDQMVEMMKLLGAEPVEMAYGQVATGLTTGLIDGAENNWPSYVTTDHFKMAKHYTLTEHTMGPEVLVMSLKVWNELSPEDQAIFRSAARRSSAFMRTQWAAWEDDARKKAAAGGNLVVSELDKAAFEAAMEPLYRRYAADAGVQALIDRIRQVDR
ncbi:2,3-diketo-L-gulonate-binding periplasmic protein YiaO precursor [Variibacter gotjawalensis]|uniref:2,3-diketo-L-gulonate-binding periplasmic protein YiaO n=1 Tax=Variibacter gotjawalensis TaxID=1333996 RepID=A0A0S3PPG3_9BRAD|nr:TRAP transporter substrate-binding protein [Variibacter gotjawalensis]NIK48127.1 tripartite ATP-independent transporter DctP family solute receptor [Variibacter gotjawalensis]RZS50003.1 tripartite ATP-independent transporter DctP family solute receptor [Variibacter gotjawalensis]BAT57830.1 2,3-diketo-L-gulonate-binding periplasmic protein YiaO precursor [Variibacter gotjawalensis]